MLAGLRRHAPHLQQVEVGRTGRGRDDLERRNRRHGVQANNAALAQNHLNTADPPGSASASPRAALRPAGRCCGPLGATGGKAVSVSSKIRERRSYARLADLAVGPQRDCIWSQDANASTSLAEVLRWT